jgi:hypothetical protein
MYNCVFLATDCAVCDVGYSTSIGYQCEQCKTGTKAGTYSASALVLAVFALVVIYMTKQLLGIGDAQDAVSNFSAFGVMQKIAALPWNKLRIPIVAFQIVTQYINITGLPLPDIYHKFLSWTDALNLNLGWLLSLGCLTQMDFYQKLLITTLGPFVVAAGLLCTHTVVRHKNKVQAVTEYSSQRMTQPARTARLEKAFAQHYLVFLAMTFLIYSTVSATVFQTFACDTIDDFASQKTSYLRADYSIQCGSSKHTLYKVYASFMLIIYPLRVPALYAWLLWCNRDKLRTATTDSSVHMLSRHKDASLRSTRSLWKSYTARMYYWEVVECMRRLLLTGAVVFIAPGTSAQAAIACILAVVSMVTAVYFRPHADTLDGTIYLVGAMIIFLSMFLSLAMKVDISSETHYNQDAFGIVLLLLNVVMIVTALVQMSLVAHRAYSSAKQKNSMYGTRCVDSHADDDLEATVETRDSNDTGVMDEQHQQQPAVHSEVRF